MPRKRRTSPSRDNSTPKLPPRSISYTTLILLSTGIVLVTLSLLWQYHEARILSFSNTRIEEPNNSVKAALPEQLAIPDLAISLAVTPSQIVDGVWEISDTSASFLIQSSSPGTGGNIVIYGHNKKKILGNLKKAKIGQSIYITTSDKVLHTYQIQQILTVNPDQIEVIQPTMNEVLTLYTCTGILDSKRLVIKAIPIH